MHYSVCVAVGGRHFLHVSLVVYILRVLFPLFLTAMEWRVHAHACSCSGDAGHFMFVSCGSGWLCAGGFVLGVWSCGGKNDFASRTGGRAFAAFDVSWPLRFNRVFFFFFLSE